jgi:hypothetical protein
MQYHRTSGKPRGKLVTVSLLPAPAAFEAMDEVLNTDVGTTRIAQSQLLLNNGYAGFSVEAT